MELIDVDGIISVMKQQAGCATCDNYNGIRCRACQWDDAITSVYDYADYHTVDAVPIEWINHYMDTELTKGSLFYSCMSEFMRDWKKEQEKQNE